MEQAEKERRERLALKYIVASHGTPDGEDGATIFAMHHLAEIDTKYWLDRFGVAAPDPIPVLEALVLIGAWSTKDDEELDVFDFSLPGEVTNYLISVRFDADGEIKSATMES